MCVGSGAATAGQMLDLSTFTGTDLTALGAGAGYEDGTITFLTGEAALGATTLITGWTGSATGCSTVSTTYGSTLSTTSLIIFFGLTYLTGVTGVTTVVEFFVSIVASSLAVSVIFVFLL